MKTKNKFINKHRNYLLLLLHIWFFAFSIWISYMIRFDFFIDTKEQNKYYNDIPKILIWVIPVKIIVFYLFKQLFCLMTYFSTPDIKSLVLATSLSSICIIIINYSQINFLVFPPRGVILIDFVMCNFLLCVFRVGCRVYREKSSHYSWISNRQSSFRVLVIGAGEVGANLVKDLINKRGLGKIPIGFLDDDPQKLGKRIHGLPVIGTPEFITMEKINELDVNEVIIAIPGAKTKRKSEIIKKLQQNRIKYTTVPSLEQLTSGKVKVSELREVEITDLLGRESISLDKVNIQKLVDSKIIMVTGAGGSIGSELCRQITNMNPSRVILVDQSEYLLYEIHQELSEFGLGSVINAVVADILDEKRMRNIFEVYKPEIIFHTAAYKHVPILENQPVEAIKNNTFGTILLAELAREYKIDRFIMISTDKAINPTNVMGVSKRIAEMYLQSISGLESNVVKYSAVRFGNVLDSSGSVIPKFKKQIKAGGPVKVTHPKVTRYFMSIPEAVGLVLQSVTLGKGGEIFVLDMGQPIKILDLAKQLIELSGLEVDQDIAIEFTGLRPGEKLYEELQHKLENIKPTAHPKINCHVSKSINLSKLKTELQNLQDILFDENASVIKTKLKCIVPEYKPYLP